MIERYGPLPTEFVNRYLINTYFGVVPMRVVRNNRNTKLYADVEQDEVFRPIIDGQVLGYHLRVREAIESRIGEGKLLAVDLESAQLVDCADDVECIIVEDCELKVNSLAMVAERYEA